jgi:hypothetical protein
MPRDPLAETFTVRPHRAGTALVRHAMPRGGGRLYRHTCPLAAYETVAHAIAEAGAQGFTLTGLTATTGLPSTQIATAMAFLRERGITEMRYPRRNYALAEGVHLDAMVEYHALREGEQPEAPRT